MFDEQDGTAENLLLCHENQVSRYFKKLCLPGE